METHCTDVTQTFGQSIARMALNVNASEIKAEEFIASAEKALKRFSIFSTSAKFEDACEAYEKAGNQYKIAKKCTFGMRCPEVRLH